MSDVNQFISVTTLWHNVCQHSLENKPAGLLHFHSHHFSILPPLPLLFTITFVSPSSTLAWTPPPLCPQGVLRPFITVVMATSQPFDSGPGPSFSFTHLFCLTPSIPLSQSSSPSFSSSPHHPPLQSKSPSCSSHNMASGQQITKSQQQVGHMMMGRPPEVFFHSPTFP